MSIKLCTGRGACLSCRLRYGRLTAPSQSTATPTARPTAPPRGPGSFLQYDAAAWRRCMCLRLLLALARLHCSVQSHGASLELWLMWVVSAVLATVPRIGNHSFSARLRLREAQLSTGARPLKKQRPSTCLLLRQAWCDMQLWNTARPGRGSQALLGAPDLTYAHSTSFSHSTMAQLLCHASSHARI